jgi:hypothetical protein
MHYDQESHIFLFIAVLLACSWLMVKITLPYFSFRYDIGFLLTKQAVLHKSIWRWSFYVHIGSSIFVLFFGIFQFIKLLRLRYLKWHRISGMVYIILVVFLSAPSGMVMALHANGGFWTKTSFLLTSLLW